MSGSPEGHERSQRKGRFGHMEQLSRTFSKVADKAALKKGVINPNRSNNNSLLGIGMNCPESLSNLCPWSFSRPSQTKPGLNLCWYCFWWETHVVLSHLSLSTSQQRTQTSAFSLMLNYIFIWQVFREISPNSESFVVLKRVNSWFLIISVLPVTVGTHSSSSSLTKSEKINSSR